MNTYRADWERDTGKAAITESYRFLGPEPPVPIRDSGRLLAGVGRSDPIILVCALSSSGAGSRRGVPGSVRSEAIVSVDERVERARLLYERAVFGGDAGALEEADRELHEAEADLALARGRVMHARFLQQREEDADKAAGDPDELTLFERAERLYRALGDKRGEAESLFWAGCFHQVVRRDDAAAVPAFERSAELASEAGDKLTMSYALRHLGIGAHAAGRLDEARERLEESTRLRREIGFLPGVAANLIGLAYIAAGQGHREDALALLEEAGTLAAASGADRILRSAGQARAEL